MKWYDKALAIYEKVLDPLSPDLAISYNNKGVAYLNQGKYEEAMKWLDKALAIKEKVSDPLSPDLAMLYATIGLTYAGMKNYDKALEYFNKALPGFIKAYGEENDDVIFLKQKIKELEEALEE